MYDLANEYLSEELMYTEAVFTDGRDKVKPIIDAFANVKSKLDEMLPSSEKTTKDGAAKKSDFDPKLYWKDPVFKKLEDAIAKVFGFRDVEIQPSVEKYNKREKEFKSKMLNAYVYYQDRFPIQGLVTDNGFYDKSHSIRMTVIIGLGVIRDLTSDELTAILLHEFGHTIDPAMVTIDYLKANALSKYLLDRKNALNNKEEQLTKKNGLVGMIVRMATKKSGDGESNDIPTFKGPIDSILDFISGGRYSEWQLNKLEEAIIDEIRHEKSEFNRYNYSEAFADNFARMYGLGASLMSGLKKISDSSDRMWKSYYTRDSERRKLLRLITIDIIRDEHKTNIHRVRALIKEYQKDIDDPNIPAAAKKHLEEDKKLLEEILDSYMNDYDEMQNRVNRTINEELNKKYPITNSDPSTKKIPKK